MKTVYIVPTWKCNLNCSHCDVHNKEDGADNILAWNDNFLGAATELGSFKEPDTVHILFGGEPTLLPPDKLYNIIKFAKIDCISTNFVEISRVNLLTIKRENIAVATSWNAGRFYDKDLYQCWLNNLNWAKELGIKNIRVLITLDPTTINSPFKTIQALEDMEKAGVAEFLFEPWVPVASYQERNIPGVFEEADKFLSYIHRSYKGNMKNLIIDKVKNWNCDCSQVFTLEPSGSLIKGCPMFKGINTPDECVTCLHGHVCRPCMLQKFCSYPKEFAKELGVL